MSAVEDELLEATGFKPKKNYDQRQDYLAALARATITIKDDVFETLSDEAADWSNDAVKAIREKKDLPEFPDVAEAAIADTDIKSGDEESDAHAPETQEKMKRRAKGQPPQKLPHPPITLPEDIEDTPLEIDKYGCTVGSKNAAAVSMLEKGCRMSDIKASIGGTYYNLLARLEKAGHSIEKGVNGLITLTHKDEK